MAKILSIQVGLPRELGTENAPNPMDRPWTTGFFKSPILEPVRVHSTGIRGDGQADLENHGGPHKAVLAYSAGHYAFWRDTRPNIEWVPGGFGENLTVADLTENDVCIGDQWACGGVLFEVSQPRQPCWKLARRWRLRTLAHEVQQNGRTGWYLRVLRGGEIAAGETLTLRLRPHAEWSVARANDVMHRRIQDSQTVRKLAELAELAPSWQMALQGR